MGWRHFRGLTPSTGNGGSFELIILASTRMLFFDRQCTASRAEPKGKRCSKTPHGRRASDALKLRTADGQAML
jgi:hypothetical protein